ncbi:hypothetical protein SOVF_100630 [Spinacia oleracea]|nr:hypothetical protein SOVF_100630 [Spinacia oleracea]
MVVGCGGVWRCWYSEARKKKRTGEGQGQGVRGRWRRDGVVRNGAGGGACRCWVVEGGVGQWW